jgi:hypothetical protein
MVAPGVAGLTRLFKDDMITALPCQIVAERKSCLASTNNNRLNKFRHINSFLTQQFDEDDSLILR